MEEVLIIGAGHQGIAMAAHLSLNGVKVNLWNRSEKTIESIKATNKIIVDGVVQGEGKINKVSTDIEEVLCNLIMVTTPSSAHKDIATMLAKYVNKKYTIILNPGRTLGAIEFQRQLLNAGCMDLPHIGETQTIVYTCRKIFNNHVRIYALKKEVMISVLNGEYAEKIIGILPKCLQKYFIPVKSWGYTSLGNVGMILHCLPVLMNVGWIENKVCDFKYYYDGISPTIAEILELLDDERILVGNKLGVELESTTDWMKRTYDVKGKSLYECIQNNTYYKEIDAPLSLHHRYIEEDVPCGLVPLESLAKYYEVDTPITSLIIDLANLALKQDFRKIGRKYEIIACK